MLMKGEAERVHPFSGIDVSNHMIVAKRTNDVQSFFSRQILATQISPVGLSASSTPSVPIHQG